MDPAFSSRGDNTLQGASSRVNGFAGSKLVVALSSQDPDSIRGALKQLEQDPALVSEGVPECLIRLAARDLFCAGGMSPEDVHRSSVSALQLLHQTMPVQEIVDRGARMIKQGGPGEEIYNLCRFVYSYLNTDGASPSCTISARDVKAICRVTRVAAEADTNYAQKLEGVRKALVALVSGKPSVLREE